MVGAHQSLNDSCDLITPLSGMLGGADFSWISSKLNETANVCDAERYIFR